MLLVCGWFVCARANAAPRRPLRWAPDELLVRPLASAKRVAHAVLATETAVTSREISPLGVMVVKTLPGRRAAVERNLQRSGAFRFVERNYIVTADALPNDPLYPQQWGLSIVSAPAAWDTTVGTGTIIAIVDTGIDISHPDLSDRIVAGYNTLTDSPDAVDDNGHGTRMAGIAAATGFNYLGIIGVAPNAWLMPIKSLDSTGAGTYADVAQGIVYATDHGARVINLSLGGAVDSSTLLTAVTYALDHGIVLVAAAGNDGFSVQAYPAAYPGVIAVAATDAGDSAATFSNYGPWISLAAPGVGILTTDLGGGYIDSTGTSPASPFVAGAAALLLSLNPQLQPQELAAALDLASDDRGAPGFDPHFGWGRLNVERAVTQAVALSDVPNPPTPVVSITSPPDTAAVEGTVPLAVNISDEPLVARVDYAVDGIVVASTSAPPFTASWDTTLVASGPHALGATAYAIAGNRGAAPPITVTVSGGPATCSSPGAACLAGAGAARKDCYAEWLVPDGPAVGRTQAKVPVLTCRDGAPCDADGTADGTCTFNLGICFAVTDPSLVDRKGAPACTPPDVVRFQITKPGPARRARDPVDAANAAAIAAGVAALNPGGGAGVCAAGILKHSCHKDTECDSAPGLSNGLCPLQSVSLAGVVPGGERCTAVEQIHVPLTRSGSVSGTRTLKTVTSALPMAGSGRISKDTDAIQLVCLPSN
jgi:thermitase